jgi:hypothetical protein
MRQQHKLVECAVCGAMVENMTKHQRWHEDFTRLVGPLPTTVEQLKRQVKQLQARVNESR